MNILPPITSPAVAVIGFASAYSQALNDAVAASIAAGVVYAAPGGDYRRDACDYSPGSLPAALTVAASWDNDNASAHTNYGSCVDVFAPGLSLCSS